MKIVVDYQSAQGSPTGIGVFTRNLMEEMGKLAPDIKWYLHAPRRQRDLNTPGRIAWESVSIPIKSYFDKVDLVYSPGFAPAVFPLKPSVVTVHDIIGVVYPGNQAAISSLYWRYWLPAALKRASKLIASSESTRRDIEKYLGIPGKRIPVVPLFAHPRFQKISNNSTIMQVLERYDLKGPFLICVGTLEPRKNLARLLAAYEILKRKGRNNFNLVIVGKDAAGAGSARRFVEEKGLARDVRFLGYVPDGDLVALYNGSLGFITVSLYEGFGLPALEAMRCGKSGVCSNRTSLPEIVGDSAILVDPENTDEIAEAMETYSANNRLRAELCSKALARANFFSPEKAAKQMIRIFNEEVAS